MTTAIKATRIGTHVAVTGIGPVGAATACRLLAAGATIDVWNRSPEVGQ